MKILFLTQYFPPEIGGASSRSSDLLKHIKCKGHNITVLSEMPHYPSSFLEKKYRGKFIVRERMDTIRVIRSFAFVSKRESFIQRTKLYISFLISSIINSKEINDIEASLEETDRALGKLGLQGVQIYSRIAGEPLDTPKFRSLYQKMAEYNLPIWLHPETNPALDMDRGLYSWPYETTSAMLRLIQSGLFYEFPDLKFIIHHAGAMVPFFAERLKWFASATKLFSQPDPKIHEHFRKFYVDTALYGHAPALQCAYEYYGADHMLFGTDAPLGPRWGMIEGTIASIERLAIPDADKEKIFSKNAIDIEKNEKGFIVTIENGEKVFSNYLIIATGYKHVNKFVKRLRVKIKKQLIKIDLDNKTNIPNMYAAGNCCTNNKQLAKNVGDGCNAAVSIIKIIKKRKMYLDYGPMKK